ncbi:hypothetical protein WH47_10691 [Habropoda laboriosa]|uniref:MADF domain-containing protein n=1 Tax=Habropoda laboriosa TaxID=597456 RepID=A0A0L7RCI2_9HYME|nr:hypothetical protein WH47_10691 [Habropoda laboriosa]
MPIAWTDSLTLRLVTLYGKHECLRNPFHPNFINKLCRYKAYKEIVDSMNVCGLTICDCIKRITYVKAQYCFELSKISAAISCEKFYKPTAIWFTAVHQLYFPFAATYSHASDFCKISDDKIDIVKDCYYNETYDQLTPSGPLERKMQNRDCDCPYAICHCERSHKTKPRTRTKSPYTQAEGKGTFTSQVTAIDDTNYLHLRSPKVTRIDAGNNTRRNIITQHATQTDISYFKTACTTCQVCMENDIHLNSTKLASILMVNDLENISHTDCIPTEEDIRGRRKIHDEFDMFGKSIAFQLRNISFEIAIKLETRIQDLIAQERLSNIKSKCSDCCSISSCSECKVFHKDMVCSCGLPVIMIKEEPSCNFDSKHLM